MSIFNREQRPNTTREEMGVITYHGLLAHGVKPNALVSPTSYIGHSNTETAKGRKHLEKMCQAWTAKQIELAIDEENRVPGMRDCVKPRVSAGSMQLISLLEELERGNIPSDIKQFASSPTAIGAEYGFNMTASNMPEERMEQAFLRSPRSAMSPRAQSPPPSGRVLSAALGAKHKMDQLWGEAALEEVKSGSFLSREPEPEPRSREEELALRSLEDASRQLGMSAGNKVTNRSNRPNLHVETGRARPSIKKSTPAIDEAWLDARIMSTVQGIMDQWNAQEDRLVSIIDKADAAIEAFVDAKSVYEENEEMKRIEEELARKARRESRSSISGPPCSVSVSNKDPVSRREEQIRREIAYLDQQLQEMHSEHSTTSSVAADDEYSGSEIDQEELDTALPLDLIGEQQSSAHEVLENIKAQIVHLERRLSVDTQDTRHQQHLHQQQHKHQAPTDDQHHQTEHVDIHSEQHRSRSASRASQRSHRSRSSSRGTERSKSPHLTKMYRNFHAESIGHDDSSDSSEEEEKEDFEVPEYKPKQSKHSKFHKSLSPVVTAVRDIMSELKSPRSLLKNSKVFSPKNSSTMKNRGEPEQLTFG